jgi:hypothetical protein
VTALLLLLSLTASIRGVVTDPLGGAVAGASIEVRRDGDGKKVGGDKADAGGAYEVTGLEAGTYRVTATRKDFAAWASAPVTLAEGERTTLDIPLSIAPVEENVTVQSGSDAVGLSPASDAGGIVLRGADLDALPDDPDELADALQALAGPAAGPNGGQIFVDGFTGGRMPPKSSIREIRINASPFSAEYDRPGFGRIEIFTKPGSDRFRGETQLRFNDESLNTRNPYAPNKPPYQRREWGGNLSGPIVAKKASFFVDFERRTLDDNDIVNATVLDPSLEPTPFNVAVLTPSERTSFSPRVDWQINGVHSLTARYSYESSSQPLTGIGGFSLPSRAYATGSHQHTLQLGETAVLGTVVNETRARFWSHAQTRDGDDTIPTLEVQESFTGGGSQVGPSSHGEKRFELQNTTSFSLGHHALRAGVRLRTVSVDDVARQGFGGTLVFAGAAGPELDANDQLVLGPDGLPVIVALDSLERYRRTVLFQGMGLSAAAIRGLGGGASQLNLAGGDPEASVRQWDVAPFVQDDWRVRPDLLVSLGLRYELQDNIDSHLNLAPRLGLAWSPGGKGASGQAKTVVRAGFGVFYDRFAEDYTLRALRYDGEQVQQYVVNDPSVLDQIQFGADNSVSNLPSVDELAGFAIPQTTWTVASELQSPVTLQASLGVDRQLPGNFTLTTSAIASQGRRLLRSRNVNAPMADGSRPLGAAAGNVYQVESTGRLNQLQWLVGLNNRLSRKLTLFARYFLGVAHGDTDGAGSFPASSYDLEAEYGRASIDVRHRVVLGGNVTGPWGVHFSPYLIASTGRPYNLTTGRDGNLDSVFTDRPAYADDPDALGVVDTPFGLLDTTPLPGQVLVARNLGDGPGFFMLNLRVSRTFSFAGSAAVAAPPDDGPPMGGPGGFRGRGGRSGGGARGLTVSVSVQNLLNHVNPGTPVGNLSSPFFGESLATAGGFGGGGSGGNRRIELQARLNF